VSGLLIGLWAALVAILFFGSYFAAEAGSTESALRYVYMIALAASLAGLCIGLMRPARE